MKAQTCGVLVKYASLVRIITHKLGSDLQNDHHQYIHSHRIAGYLLNLLVLELAKSMNVN